MVISKKYKRSRTESSVFPAEHQLIVVKIPGSQKSKVTPPSHEGNINLMTKGTVGSEFYLLRLSRHRCKEFRVMWVTWAFSAGRLGVPAGACGEHRI